MTIGLDKLIEDRIKKAQKDGQFDDLPGKGKPIEFEDDTFIPEELRLAFKILKNADFCPPEVELKKEAIRTEELLSEAKDEKEKYTILKKLNFLIMKINTIRGKSIKLDMPQHFQKKVVEKLSVEKDKK